MGVDIWVMRVLERRFELFGMSWGTSARGRGDSTSSVWDSVNDPRSESVIDDIE